jgi:hypothetical protein
MRKHPVIWVLKCAEKGIERSYRSSFRRLNQKGETRAGFGGKKVLQ